MSVLFIGYCSLLYPQFEGVFMTEPEIDYDLYHKTCDVLIDSTSLFFAERVSHIPEEYEKGVKVFFTAERNGGIKDVEFEENLESEFDIQLSCFLRSFKFNNSPINNFLGDAFNTRMSIMLIYNKHERFLNVLIEHYTYWKEEYPLRKDIEIKKLKPIYDKTDTITFNLINNLEQALYFSLSLEGRLRGQLDWIDSSVWGSSISQDNMQIEKIESKNTISKQLLVKNFYEVPDYYRIVINYGLQPSVMNEKIYSYSFIVKKGN